MKQKDEFDPFDEKKDKRRLILLAIGVAVLAVAVVACAVLFFGRHGKKKGNQEADRQDAEELPYQEDDQDPQNKESAAESQEGAKVDVARLLSAQNAVETEGMSVGIDVAKYQGVIDWEKAASSGIDFAMIRVGYRTMKTGEICEDPMAKYNLQNAKKAGLMIGAYFFSSAVSEEEAAAEADWVADYVAQYQITYPVAYNCEGFGDPENRQHSLDKTRRTDIAAAFLNRIYERGYTPMFYGSKSELEGESQWETSRLESTYRIWVSQYPAESYPGTSASDYSRVHAMWQHTSQGTIPGISGKVDVNLAYFRYDSEAKALSDIPPEQAKVDVEALLDFHEVSETVTAKEKANLRDKPSQDADSNIVAALQNQDTAERTGISDSGWSRVVYNGETLYAVSSYLTTDLGYSVPEDENVADTGDGLKTKFTAVSDTVTAKIEVNLRTLPSVTNPDAAVTAVLHNGEIVTRTGIASEQGWSRVEYNGQTLYCITSYLSVVE